MERPERNGQFTTLVKTTNVRFDPVGVSTTAPGPSVEYTPLMNSTTSTLYDIQMLNNANTGAATPSNADSDQDGFTIKDGATAPPPPAS